MSKRKIPSLTLEYFQDQTNLLYLSLVEYKKETFITIIDNIKSTEITAFVLDFVEPEGIDMATFLSIANIWYYKSSGQYPLSIELAQQGLTETFSPIMKTYDIDNISRIVGLPFTYDVDSKPKVKRRRIIPIPSCVEIVLKKTKIIKF